MVAGCGMKCIKYIVFFVNFLFFVMGVVSVALGIWALVDKNDMHALTKIDTDGRLGEFNGVGLMQSGAIVLIVGGSFLLLLGFFGCCGAVRESRCLLGLYSAIVLIIVIIEVTAAGLAIAFRGKIEDFLKDGMKGAVSKYYDGQHNSTNAFSRAFDFAQVYFQCCGVENATTDFRNSKWYNETASKNNHTVPDTCCELTDRQAFYDHNSVTLRNKTCPIGDISLNNPFTAKPCFESIKDWITTRAGIIIGIAIGIILIEILAIVFACCLMTAIKEEGMTV